MNNIKLIVLSEKQKRRMYVGYFWWIFKIPEIIHEVAPYVRDSLTLNLHSQPNFTSYSKYDPFHNNLNNYANGSSFHSSTDSHYQDNHFHHYFY